MTTAKQTETKATEVKASLFSSDGSNLGEIKLDPEIFGIEPNLAVLHQVVTAQLAGARAGTHKTKKRSEVRGGGAKPWRQKGTGRARAGSIRAPNWRGGGVAHGPDRFPSAATAWHHHHELPTSSWSCGFRPGPRPIEP